MKFRILRIQLPGFVSKQPQLLLLQTRHDGYMANPFNYSKTNFDTLGIATLE